MGSAYTINLLPSSTNVGRKFDVLAFGAFRLFSHQFLGQQIYTRQAAQRSFINLLRNEWTTFRNFFERFYPAFILRQPEKFGRHVHEGLENSQAVEMGSERSFGLVFAVFFGLLAGFSFFKGSDGFVYLAGATGIFLVLALAAPKVLKPLNIVWFKFGLLLHKIVSPLIMGLLFYLTVTPIALIVRSTGKDPLRLKLDGAAKSYWIERDPPGPAPESLTKQF